MDDTGTAHQIGYIIGVIIALSLTVGCLGTFVLAMVMSFKTRKTGWIVTAVISGLPIAAFILLFMISFIIGFVHGFKKGYERARERHSLQWPAPIVYQVCLPDLPGLE